MSAYGVRVGVRADDTTLLARLCARLPPGSETLALDDLDAGTVDFLYAFCHRDHNDGEDAGRVSYVGLAGNTPFIDTTDLDAALDAFESAVRFDVAVTTTDWVFVHAGVVAWRDGVLVVPAPSMHGKSTLIDTLVRAGVTYYSDEFCVIDRQGLVHPFRIPLSLRDGRGGARRVRPEPADALPALPIRLVASTSYEAGARWHPRRGGAGDALMALLANTVRARIAPGPTLNTLAKAVEHAAALTGPRGDADETAASLLREWP